MQYITTITAEHVSNPASLGEHGYFIANAIGRLQPSDVGKRVFQVSPTVYQVENTEQRDARLKAEQGPPNAVLSVKVMITDAKNNLLDEMIIAGFPHAGTVEAVSNLIRDELERTFMVFDTQIEADESIADITQGE